MPRSWNRNRRTRSGRSRATPLAAAALGVALLSGPAASWAKPIPPASLGMPFGDPLVDLDAELTALKVTTWIDPDQPGTRMLLLEQDVTVRIGGYGFNAERAVIRIEREDAIVGPVHHLAILFDEARPLPGVGAIRAEGKRLLVTSSTRGSVRLVEPGLLEQANDPPSDPLIEEASSRIAAQRVAAAGPGLAVPQVDGVPESVQVTRARRRAEIAEQQRALYEKPAGDAVHPITPDTPANESVLAESILPLRGALAYSTGTISAQFNRPDGETAVSLIGDVRLVFEDYENDRVITLKADRVVMFVGDDAQEGRFAPTGSVDAGTLRGVYLEDNAVISDGQYTVRAPRVFYDMSRNKATLLDAVFYTYDLRHQVPLYVRAEKIRQTSASDFQAENAKLTTSEFAVPHFSIGAGELNLRQYETSSGQVGQYFTANDATLNVGDVPVFYWPYIAAFGRETPLRSLSAGYSSNDGPEVETTWDLYALIGKEKPDNVDLQGELDYRGDHGWAIGANGNYNTDDAIGDYRGYFLFNDDGEDEIGGRVIDQDDEQRGFLRARHRAYLPANLELSLEGAYVSDPTFLETFFPEEASESKTYETSAYLKWQQQSSAFDLLATTNLSGFTEQLDLLQYQGYNVEKYPELGYRVIGGDLLDGRVSWFSQTSFTQQRILPGDDTPGDRGFDNNTANQLFGVPAGTSFRQAAELANLPTERRLRLDSRQEFSAPLAAGQLDVTPYAVGRVTAYDDDFSEYNGGNNDSVRLWGEVGLRVGTEFSRTMPGVQSSILDLDGIRHVVEPSATIFVNGSTLDSGDLPVYDYDVERLSDGAGTRLGLVNTWQTRRGGPGRQRTVDWVTLRTDLVLRADDAEVDTEIARFYDYRPEYSVGGDHFYGELLWMVTDTLGLAGEITHSFESDRVVQWRAGASLDHSPRLASYVSYNEIDLLDSQLLTWGFGYLLTTKYRVGFSQTVDFSDSGSRSYALTVDRKLPRWTLQMQIGYDEIDDEQTYGITLIPDGTGRSFRPVLFN